MKAKYIKHSLTDNDVANAARQSFSRLAEEFTDEQNHNLIRFLARGMSTPDWENLLNEMVNCTDKDKAKELATYLRSIPEHWVPFGHPHITLQMQAPVPITVQCYKHKIGFVESGESRRYVSSEPEFFIPEFRSKAENVKQGSGDTHPSNDGWKEAYDRHMTNSLALYKLMIKDNICPEQARFVLPQGTELNWVWTGSLFAFANFYNLRTDPHSQKEIQDLAEEVGKIIEPLYPVSWAALTQGAY